MCHRRVIRDFDVFAIFFLYMDNLVKITDMAVARSIPKLLCLSINDKG